MAAASKAAIDNQTSNKIYLHISSSYHHIYNIIYIYICIVCQDVPRCAKLLSWVDHKASFGSPCSMAWCICCASHSSLLPIVPQTAQKNDSNDANDRMQHVTAFTEPPFKFVHFHAKPSVHLLSVIVPKASYGFAHIKHLKAPPVRTQCCQIPCSDLIFL